MEVQVTKKKTHFGVVMSHDDSIPGSKNTGFRSIPGEFLTHFWRVDLPHVDVAHQPLHPKNGTKISWMLPCKHLQPRKSLLVCYEAPWMVWPQTNLHQSSMGCSMMSQLNQNMAHCVSSAAREVGRGREGGHFALQKRPHNLLAPNALAYIATSQKGMACTPRDPKCGRFFFIFLDSGHTPPPAVFGKPRPAKGGGGQPTQPRLAAAWNTP